MKKIIFVSLFALLPAAALASDDYMGNYYETNTGDCGMTGMRRELDKAVIKNRAVVTVVKCAKEAPKP
jgi:fructose-1,6-bisphosphatase/sedoheptulose 1,7-bisphosphatase-like protein